jgi:hypothetical protein
MAKKPRYKITGFSEEDAYFDEAEKYVGGTGYFYGKGFAGKWENEQYYHGDFMLESWPKEKPKLVILSFYEALLEPVNK